MYFEWNLISFQIQAFLYRQIRNTTSKAFVSTSLRIFVLWKNGKTITETREKIWDEKVIFFHLMLNNITCDKRLIEKREKKCWCRTNQSKMKLLGEKLEEEEKYKSKCSHIFECFVIGKGWVKDKVKKDESYWDEVLSSLKRFKEFSKIEK